MAKASELLKDLMAQKNVGKEQMAARLGVSVKTIENWLKDSKVPQKGNFSEIVRWLEEKPEIKGPDYKEKVIELLEDKVTALNNSTSVLEAEIEGLSVKVINKDLQLISAMLALETKVDYVTDLFHRHLAAGDQKKRDQLSDDMNDKNVNGLKVLLEKYRELGLIDF
jgi:transcriptional regulator with XRE-family HTH domain